MKPALKTLMVAALMTQASHAITAPVADLSIKGLIVPVACTPTLSNNGLVDYGKLSRQDLSLDKRTQLRDQTLEFSIQCNNPARFALLMHDNREGSAIVNSEIYYGLNHDPSGNKIGLYSLNFDPTHTVVDGWPQVFRTDSTTGGLAWSTSSSRPIPVGARSYLGFTNVAGSNAGPLAIQTLTSRVTVETVIAPTSELDLSVDTQLDGSATLDVVYL